MQPHEWISVEPVTARPMPSVDEHYPRVGSTKLRAAFVDGWSVRSIDPAKFAITIDENGAQAWLATIEHV